MPTPYRYTGTTYDGVRIIAPKGPSTLDPAAVRRAVEQALKDKR